MKRISLVVGMVVLSAALLLGPTGASQLGQMPSMEPLSGSNIAALQQEIQLLKAINRADLRVEQLRALQGVLTDLQAADDALGQSQQELRRFLVNWQGDPADLDTALEPHEQRLSEAHQTHRDAYQAAVNRIKGIFTIRQGEVLMQALSPKKMDDKSMMSGSNGMMGMMGSSQDAPQDGQEAQTDSSPSMQAMRERMKDMMSQMMENCPMMSGSMGKMASPQAKPPRVTQIGSMIIKNRNLWATVVNDKLTALEDQTQ